MLNHPGDSFQDVEKLNQQIDPTRKQTQDTYSIKTSTDPPYEAKGRFGGSKIFHSNNPQSNTKKKKNSNFDKQKEGITTRSTVGSVYLNEPAYGFK